MVWKKFAAEAEDNVLVELVSSTNGLSSHEAGERLASVRANVVKSGSSALVKALRQRLASSFLYLLLAAATLSFLLQDYLEGCFILAFILINLSLETYQEYHSNQAMQLLKRYLVVHARVRRDGKVIRVESTTVVPGDIVLVEAGDRLPADVRFLHTNGLKLDESIMTGESIAVTKTAELLKTPPAELYEALNIGFAGTVVTSGSGEGVVFATGKETALGDIALLTEDTEKETVFEKGMNQFSRFILKLVFFTLTLIYVANVAIKGGSLDWVDLLIFSLALAVSVIPEALPVILTVALSRGSLRLARKKVVVKRLSAIEDLGSIEILCCDKTGTLTENLLSVVSVNATDKHTCLKLAFASSLVVPVERGKLHDAFDLALWQALSSTERQEMNRGKRLDAIPFDPERRCNSVLFDRGHGHELIMRGAPEEILRRSRNIDTYTSKQLMQWVALAGERGERVLAIAHKTVAAGRKYSPYEEQDLQFVGLIAFSDVLKTTARATLVQAQALNVAIKIITGDSREVAGAVGYAVGLLKSPKDVVTGKELDEMTETKRRQAIAEGAVFARISPRQKFEIIKTLQEKHEVGFLGEGINDAPALKLANVAIVVESASDIAREAADVVLLDESLKTVVEGIREGRTIFANILKYLKITLTSNFGNFYSVALASLFLPFVPLLPMQILLIDLLSDFPMISIATDTVDSEELEKPKNYQVHTVVLMATMLGIVSSVFDFILFGALYHVSPETLQTAWFLLSLTTEVILVFSLRTKFSFFKARRPSWTLLSLSLTILAIGWTLPFIPVAAHALHFIVPSPRLLLFIGALVVSYFFATEAVKKLYYRHMQPALVPVRKIA